ncbi:MAG: hypothetical protein U9Q88_15975 [Bacillota bacterium]|nr:hypothetical protein [Bacillota bacterium]
MQNNSILQTIGTVSSLIMAIITLKITHSVLEIDLLNLKDVLSKYAEFLITFSTIFLMIVTGFSYYNTRIEHEGITRLLYVLVALAHTILAPSVLIIGIMKIEFGQYWLAALIGIFILIYWGSKQIQSQS